VGPAPGRVLRDAGIDERRPGDGLVRDDPDRASGGCLDPDHRAGGPQRGAGAIGLVDAPVDRDEQVEGGSYFRHTATVGSIAAGF
jgi:hypothetical protein